jgi:hypothetical protein
MSRRKEFNKPDKIYVYNLRKKPKIKQETHKIMGVPLHVLELAGFYGV